MTTTETTPVTTTVDQAIAWLDATWDPDMTVAEWWQQLADARLSNPMLAEPWGRGWGRAEAAEFASAMVAKGALGPPTGIGMMLAVPTILAHGSPEVIERYVPSILNGQDGWCQLFSEPGAGSDLAGMQTRAERDGDEWVINGQKVWTSGGQWADYGILVARSDPDQPKHKGLTYFAFSMHQPGVEVRPLREMTGQAMFNEVFFSDARVADADMIGDLNDGWRVANTTLMVERAGIGGANAAAPSAAIAGTVAKHLGLPAGSFDNEAARMGGGGVGHKRVKQFIELAQQNGRIDDPTIRQEIARLYSMVEITTWHMGRMRTGNAATGGEGNLAKLRNSDMTRLAREIGAAILGAGATITGPDSPTAGDIQELIIFSPAPSIYGGTDQVQRNIIGERVLGLAKEPGPASTTPFRELLQNPMR